MGIRWLGEINQKEEEKMWLENLKACVRDALLSSGTNSRVHIDEEFVNQLKRNNEDY